MTTKKTPKSGGAAARNARLAGVCDANPNPVLVAAADGAVVYRNRVAERMLAGEPTPAEIEAILPFEHENIVRAVLEGDHAGLDSEVNTGKYVIVWTYVPQRDEQIVYLYGRDVTVERRTQQLVLRDAFYDPLTDLPNWLLLTERMGRAIRRAEADPEYRYALLYLDLDRFKIINESLGHSAGDTLLRAVAGRLRGLARPSDTVARHRGDEFYLFLDGIDGETQAVHVAERVRDALAAPFVVQGEEIFTGASIGIAVSGNNRPHVAPDDVLQEAERAMYRAKAGGKARYEFADPNVESRARHLLRIETAMRKALVDHEFILHYQPIVSLTDGKVFGFEALVRWIHPEKGMIPPNDFIPLAEETGLIVPLGEWVMRHACEQAVAWKREGLGRLIASVNVSARQFVERNVVDVVARALVDTGIDPNDLKLEITEGTAAHDAKYLIEVLNRLKEMKVLLLIDDFGTGYSSLSYLQKFPIDNLKIDKSFVDNVTTNADSVAIVRAIIAMAHSLGMKTTAEGVEDAAQVDVLRREGCDHFQGYYFSRPLPAAQFAELIRSGKCLTFSD